MVKMTLQQLARKIEEQRILTKTRQGIIKERNKEIKQKIKQIATKTKQAVKSGIKEFQKTEKINKKVGKAISAAAGMYGYKSQASSNLLKYAQAFNTPRQPRQPSPAQLQQRAKFAQQQRQFAQMRQMQRNQQIMQQQGSNQQIQPIQRQPQPQNIQYQQQQPQQFERPQAKGVWAANPNSGIASKMPRNTRIWQRKPIYGLEGDIMGNIKLKEFGTEEAFFN